MFGFSRFFGGNGATVEKQQPPLTENETMASIAKLEPKAKAGTVHWFNECVERGKRSVFSESISVTPGLAAEMLRRNENNRSIRAAKAEQYANDMRAGNWTFNGEPIIIADTGELNDGQHRMQAIIDANTIVEMLFVFGLPRASRETIDQGAARGASDYLGMGGMPNASTAATIARLAIAYEASDGQNIDNRLVTNAQVVARVRNDPQITESAHFAVTTGRTANQYVAGTIIGFCHYLFTGIDADDAQEFLGQVCSGAGLKPGSAALAVRERLLASGKARQPKVAILFRGWNFYRRNMKVRPTSLPSTMPFPSLI